MDRKTAAKYLNQSVPMSRAKGPRTYRTRLDPLAPFWEEIEELLKRDSSLKPYAILEHMLERHHGVFKPDWQRTLERRVAQWKVTSSIEQDVTFDQVHPMADVLAFDFTSMNDLGVNIAGERFDHMLFHSVLTHSNWEYVELCFSESFEAVASGIQNSFLTLGGVTKRVRNDSLTAAVNNLSVDRQFQSNFKSLLEHFHVQGHRINVRSPNENGDCESLHGHLKKYIDQRLRLRGNRDFETTAQWMEFVNDCVKRKNQSRQDVFRKEQAALTSLPQQLFPTYTEMDVNVRSNSVVTIKQNSYSIPSCFIGHKVHVRIYADTIELWYASKMQFEMPRLVGKDKEFIDFRHVIDSLRRKPGAFVNYRYREHMYPTLVFRQAFDRLVNQLGDTQGLRAYLKILYAAKYDGFEIVEQWLRDNVLAGGSISAKALDTKLKQLKSNDSGSLVPEVSVGLPELDVYDDLLKHKEVLDELTEQPIGTIDNQAIEQATEPRRTGFPFETSSASNDSTFFGDIGRASGQRELESLGVSGRIDFDGMPSANRESSPTPTKEIETSARQDLERNQMGSDSDERSSEDGSIAQRRVFEANQQRLDIWEARLGEDAFAFGVRGCDGESGASRVLCPMFDTGSALAVSETGTETSAVACEAWPVLSIDHRRLGLCSTESRGDGSALYLDRGSLRKDEHFIEQQSPLFEMGRYLQGPDDNGGGNRSLGTSQRDFRDECTERQAGTSEGGTRSSGAGESHSIPVINFLEIETFRCGSLIAAKVEM